MHESMSQVSEEAAQNRGRMLKFRIDSSPGSNKMRHDMPIHEREETFKIDSEDGPWVSKWQAGKCKVNYRTG